MVRLLPCRVSSIINTVKKEPLIGIPKIVLELRSINPRFRKKGGRNCSLLIQVSIAPGIKMKFHDVDPRT